MGGAGVKVVVPVRGLAWLVAGTALGCSLLGPWLQEMQDRARGYRWNYRDRCIADEVSQLVFCLNTDCYQGYFAGGFCRPPLNCSSCETVVRVEEFSLAEMTEELYTQQ